MLKRIFSVGMLEVLGMLIPILVLPMLSRTLSERELADYLLITTFIVICQQVIDYSFTYICGRWTRQELEDNFSAVVNAKLTLSLFCTVASIPIFIFQIESASWIVFISILFGIISCFISVSWYFAAINLYHVFQKLNFYIKSTLVVWASFAPSMFGFESFLLLYFSTAAIASLILSLAYLDNKLLKVYKVDFFSGWRILAKNYHLFVADFIPQLYVTLPLIIFKSSWDHQLYTAASIAVRFYNAGMSVQWMILKLIIPSSKNYQKTTILKMNAITLSLAFAYIFFAFFVASYVIEIMFVSNVNSIVSYFQILSLGYIGAALYVTNGYAMHILCRTENILKRDSLIISIPASILVWSMSSYFFAYGFIVSLVCVRSLIGLHFTLSALRKF